MPGVELARSYWFEVVAPIVDHVVPAAERAAALIGYGSDVLGFDTEQSTDHGWGPRVFLFVRDEVGADARTQLVQRIDDELPDTFRGYPTRFVGRDNQPARHQVMVTSVGDLFGAWLGVDPRGEVTAASWLRVPTQELRSLVGGAVFEDGFGELSAVRAALTWYPDEVWRYALACQWHRLAQEEAFAGRCAQVGDDLGSAVVAARLVRDLMKLCFLVAREYAPYSKWLGTAFARLACGTELAPVLRGALAASEWSEREQHLGAAFEAVARRFNALGIVEPLDPTVRPFYVRPFTVLDSDRFALACLESTPLRELGWPGAIDQFVDSTDVVAYPPRIDRIAHAFWP